MTLSSPQFVWDWAGSRADYERALALEPASADIWRGYSRLLSALGRLAEATAAATRSTQLDPLNAACWTELGYLLANGGRTAEAPTTVRSTGRRPRRGLVYA